MEGEGDDKASPPPAPLGRSSSGAFGGSKKTYEEMCEGLPPRSLLMLSLNNPIRKGAVMVVKNRNFDRAVLLLIVINCVFLAMDSKAPDFRESQRGCERAPPTETLPGSVSTRRASADSARSLARSFFSSAPTRRSVAMHASTASTTSELALVNMAMLCLQPTHAFDTVGTTVAATLARRYTWRPVHEIVSFSPSLEQWTQPEDEAEVAMPGPTSPDEQVSMKFAIMLGLHISQHQQ